MVAGLLAFLLLAVPAAPQEEGPAELVLHGGLVRTLDPDRPLARAVAVRGGRILFAGSDREALALAGPETRLLDLRGHLLLPGFQDAHAHLAGFGLALRQVDLTGTRSLEEVVRRSVQAARDRPAGAWILGRGWDQNDWADTALPHHRPLSEALPEHPVVLTRVDGHALLANAAAMRAAGVDPDQVGGTDPPGGRILRDASGRPTGVFVDAAMGLVRRGIPPAPPGELRAAVEAAIAAFHARGVTGIHDAGVDTPTLELYRAMLQDGDFALRDHVLLRGDPETLGQWLPGGPVLDLEGRGRVQVRAIKLSADGALGSRGARLLEDYDDEPGHRGLVLTPPERVREVAVQALQHGFQLCVHAIGDGANRFVLDAFEAALAEIPRADHRFRIEHAQVLHPDDLPRFAALGVIPSMQAQHQTSDMPWVLRRIGPDRARLAYAWRSLLDTGVILPGGSDVPVERADPLAAFRAAVFRRNDAGFPAGGWFPEQAMSREEALLHLCRWPAAAAFQEQRMGSIEAGKVADLVVVSEDLATASWEGLLRARVLLTVFDGRIVYSEGTLAPPAGLGNR